MKKRIVLLLFVLIMSLNICGCDNTTPEEYSRIPLHFLGSVWENEDGSCTIDIVEDPNYLGSTLAIGTIRTYDEDIPVSVSFAAHKIINIYPIEYLTSGSHPHEAQLEHWDAKYKSEEEFIALVRETTYFNVGQRMVFHRIK